MIQQTTFQDRLRALDPAARYSFLRDNWHDVQAANTTDSALVTDMLASGAVTVLQNRCAPLSALTRDFGIDRMKPSAKVQIRTITAGGTAQTNATSFEDTTNFVATNAAEEVTVAQYTAGAHLTNAERQSGHKMADWIEIKVAELADAIMGAVAAKIVTDTFPAIGPYDASAFSWDEIKDLWGRLKKSTIKNLILDGDFLARFLPETRKDWDGTSGLLPGWTGLFLNTVWTGATANTAGFACNPQAIGVAAGLPMRSPNAAAVSRETIITLPGLGLSVALTEWFSNSTRADWATYDVMFGAVATDPSAGIIIART